jgi:hypothetical protein
MPLISAWDIELQRWLHRVVPAKDVRWSSAKGSLRVSKGTQRTILVATDTASADLPADWYLFRVSATGQPGVRQVITAGRDVTHDFVVGDLPPPVDVAVRLTPEPVYLLQHHDGGVLAVNLVSSATSARIEAVETFRITGLEDYRDAREHSAEQPLPRLSSWAPDQAGGVTVTQDGEVLAVTGNATPSAYQLVSPRIIVRPEANVTVRLPITIDAGQVCTGVLDDRQQTWLVTPSDHSEVHRFSTGPNHGVFIVVSNCQRELSGSPASRFRVANGHYTAGRERWYTDELMRSW